MTHPYQQFEDTPIWRAVSKAITQLEKNHDIGIVTSREHIVGFIAKTVSEISLSSLSQAEFIGVVGTLNEACHGSHPIEDWECQSLIGLTKPELETVLRKLSGETEPSGSPNPIPPSAPGNG